MLATRHLGLLITRRAGPACEEISRKASSWQLVASAIVERPAIIVRQFNPFEKAYLNLLNELEAESSLLSDHELQSRADSVAREKGIQAGEVKVKLAEDLLKEWKAELDAFWKAHPRHIKLNVKQSDVNRHIDESLALLVEQKLGDKYHWLFPQAECKKDETLRQTAERAVHQCFGDSLELQTMGNAPVAFYKYKYPKALQESSGMEGAKVFYMKMTYKSGEAILNKEFGREFAWATHMEMLNQLPATIVKAIKAAFFVAPKIDFTPFLEHVAEREELRKRNIIDDATTQMRSTSGG